MQPLSQRAQEMGLPMTIEMAQKARELSATGKDVISLSLGEPDFDTPDFIKASANEAMIQNFTHYMPVPGFADVRQAIADKFKRDNHLDYTAEQIVISTGAKQSLLNIFLALVDPGEEVIIPAPYWVSYMDQAKYCGAEVKILPTTMESGFKITPDQLENSITDKSKIFIFSSPNNPCGAIYTEDELAAIAAIIARYPNLYVISDEIYELLNYGEVAHTSMASFPSVYNQTITVNGLSKGFAMTGWRIGYLGAPNWIAKACTKMQGQFTSAPTGISQKAAQAAVEADPEVVEHMKHTFKKRRDLVLGLLNKIEGIKCTTPPGAFYLFPDVSFYLGKSYDGKTMNNAGDLCMFLLEVGNVALVTGEAFGNPECVRISYAASDKDLVKAAKRIKESLALLS